LCLVNQPRFWLAATAAIFRNMRAIIDSFYVTAVGGHGCCHVLMDFLECFLCGHFSIDDGLICDHDHMIPMKGQALHGLKTPGQKLKFRPTLDIIGSILIDDAISV
jgi:hypothetical protein